MLGSWGAMGSGLWWLPWLLLLCALGGLAFVLDKWLRLRALEHRRALDGPPPLVDADAAHILSVLRSASAVVDADGEIISASPPAYSMGLVRADEIVPAAVVDLVKQVRATGETEDMELELPRSMPGAPPLLVRVRVADIGKGRILVMASDRTEFHRIDTIRRDFVVNVSQQLSTPVAVIGELAATMRTDFDSPERLEQHCAQLAAEANRLAALIEELIELTRVQGAGALSDSTTVHLREVIQEAVEREQRAADAKNIRLTTAGAEDVLVHGDRELLITAVRNLLDNAINYSPNNTRVGVGVSEVGGFVEIAVVDQGMGIAAGEQDRVFERFYRTDRARSRVAGSTGLGLSLVKHIAAGHGGEVTVWSAPNRGSTFTLRIPAADVTGVGAGAPEVVEIREAPREAQQRRARAFSRKANAESRDQPAH